jgi:hypothetical protein
MHPGTMLTDAIRQWPSPRAEDSEQCGNHPGKQDSLTGATRHWPTPNTGEGTRGADAAADREGSATLTGEASAWPTPTSVDDSTRAGRRQNPDGKGGRVLTETAEQWPTPNVPNGGRSSSTSNYDKAGNKRQIDLGAAAATWPTPVASDSEQRGRANNEKAGRVLKEEAQQWPTPAARDYRTPNSEESQDRRAEGREHAGQQLPNFVAHHWPTPTAMDAEQAGSAAACGETRGNSLDREVKLWQTPATDSFRSRSVERKDEQGLDQQAREFWPTPTAEPYGSSQNGINGIGGEFERPSAATPSLEKMSHSFLPDLLTSGPGAASSPPDPTSPRLSDLWKTPHGIANTDQYGHTGGGGGEFHKQVMRANETWSTPRVECNVTSQKASTPFAEGGSTSKPGLAQQAQSLASPAGAITTASAPTPTSATTPTTAGWPEADATALPATDGTTTPASSPKAKLNPQFVEWLMGLPIGWTGFAPVAMASYRSKQRWHLWSWLGGPEW